MSGIVLPLDGGAGRGRETAAEVCHVTVQAGRSRVDLALPAAVPLLEITPQLAVLCRAGTAGSGQRNGHAHGTPPAWTLARAGGAPFDLRATLEESGVLDGEVLHLVDVASWRAPVISDVADAVSDVIEDGALRWPGEAGRWLLGGLSTACLVTAAGVAVAVGALGGASGLLALPVAALLGLGAVLSRRVAGWGPARGTLALAAVGLTALAGWGLAGGQPGAVGVGAAAAGALVAMLAVGVAVPALAPGGVLVGGVLTAGAAAVARGAAPGAVAAVVAVAGVVALRTWPPLVGRLLSMLGPAVSVASAEEAARRTRRLLASLSGGTAVLLLGAVLALLAGGTLFTVGLAAVCVVALALRARTYRFLPEALPPALAAAASLFAAEVIACRSLLAPPGQPALAVGLLAGTGVVALGGLMLLPRAQLAPGRGVRLAWLAVDVAVGPMALGALGVLDLLEMLVHHLVH